MGFLDSVFGRRASYGKYRTVDGGHPAPYPDMTDEQLYNYERTFNVPKRTFDKPPRPMTPPHFSGNSRTAAGKAEPRLFDDPYESFARTVPPAQPSAAQSTPPQQAAFSPADSRPASGTQDTVKREKEQEKDNIFDMPPRFARAGHEQPRADASLEAADAIDPVHADPKEKPAQESTANATVSDDVAAAPRLDFTRPVRTITTKQPVDIITTRARHPVYKVHAYIGGDDIVTVFTIDGRLSENGPHFLENVPEMRQLYVNIYPNPDVQSKERFLLTQHENREDADAVAITGRIACVEIKLDGS